MIYILFDLDRTLWDFDGNARRTYSKMFDVFNIEHLCHIDFDTFHARYCEINDMLWEAYRNGAISKEQLSLRRFSFTLEAFGCDPESLEIVRLSNRMSDYYVTEGRKQTGLMPGAKELLQWLGQHRDKFRLGVITNGFSEAQRPKMKTSGIDIYFDFFFLSEELGFLKPDPRFFEKALQQMNVEPGQCMVVGDDYKVDVEGAQLVGIPQVWYNPKQMQLPENAAPPTHEITNLLQMIDILCTNQVL